jgi:hypothetical protein
MQTQLSAIEFHLIMALEDSDFELHQSQGNMILGELLHFKLNSSRKFLVLSTESRYGFRSTGASPSVGFSFK